MSTRYAHWYFRCKRTAQPRSIVCVEADVRASRDQAGSSFEVLTLSRWHSTSAVREETDYVKAKNHSGTSAALFWKQLGALARLHAPVWVFCSRAPAVWGALGLWEEIEKGNIIVPGLAVS